MMTKHLHAVVVSSVVETAPERTPAPATESASTAASDETIALKLTRGSLISSVSEKHVQLASPLDDSDLTVVVLEAGGSAAVSVLQVAHPSIAV